MIPFGSQRGLGGDLATHLLNEHDNEQVELVHIRGAVARDLHGAFEEWELQAGVLTRCEKYLYSLSVNPDPRQGELTQEQYLAYIDKAEDTLGLSGQPRAVVFHEKDGRHHCHVVWSRIDVENEKAVHIAFDRQKLMAVTRDFAREHDLELPAGYYKDSYSRPRNLYDRVKEAETGISHEQRKEQVTDAWVRSDSPKAFIRALEERGYVLATGKRPYVLVDIYGHQAALPRLIDDRQVRARDVRKFLGAEYPPESLPSVEEARRLVARQRDLEKSLAASEQRALATEKLEKMQTERRTDLDKKMKALAGRHHRQREELAKRQRQARDHQNAAFKAQQRHIYMERVRRRPRGLAAFLGKLSGINLVRAKFHKYQDRKRLREFLRRKEELRARQAHRREQLKRRQILQKRVLERQDRALKKIERRERRALDQQLLAEQRTLERGGSDRMPPIAKDKERAPAEKGALSNELNIATGRRTKLRRKDLLAQEFTRAAGGEERDGEEESGRADAAPKRTRKRRRKREQDYDRGR